jgi:dTDP-4-amino-4,6-dideoxygalactose transaminase
LWEFLHGKKAKLPAIHFKESLLNKKIYLSPPHLSGEELSYIQDALASNWIAPVGPHIEAFEQEIAATLLAPDAVVVNSGTAAIHLGLLTLGVGAGDEVICPTLTFCATANPIIYCGATPVFVDSESETWNMDPQLLEEAINDRIKVRGRKPKAIIVVHLYGMPAKMNEILSLSRKFDIPVLEDAAEALGSLYYGQPVGSLGDAGILSFNGNKIITTSGGGAFISKNGTLIQRARFLRAEAKEPLPYYEHKEIGYNYRLSNISAAIGRAQLKSLANRVERRREIFDYYKTALEETDGVSFQNNPEGFYSNRWLTVIKINNKNVIDNPRRLSSELEKNNIESRLAWKPMHLQPVFTGTPAYVNGVSEDLFDHSLCLPSGTAMGEEDMQLIVKILKQQLN